MRQNNCFPLISVLIPVYNAELFLVECLDGILSQTYPNLEIICLDDASTDGSFRLLTDYAAKDPRIKLIKQEQHHGIAVARNTLLRHISGEYFAFVDADDLIDPAYVEHLYQTASRTGADITRCLYNLLDIRNGSVQPCETLYREFVAPISPVTPVQRLQAAQDDSQVWLKLIKTSLIKEHHLSFIPHVLPEDISFENPPAALYARCGAPICQGKSPFAFADTMDKWRPGQRGSVRKFFSRSRAMTSRNFSRSFSRQRK